MVCAGCPYLAQCTNSKEHVKTVTQYVRAADLDEMEDNRYTYGIREYYKLHKETIEQDFALAKKLHFPLYAGIRTGADGVEIRAYFCLHKFEKTR